MDHLCYSCLVVLCFHAHLFVDALRSPAGKGLTSLLSFAMSNCDVVTFPLVSWVIVSIPDLCPLSYFQKATNSLKELLTSLKEDSNVGCDVISDTNYSS